MNRKNPVWLSGLCCDHQDKGQSQSACGEKEATALSVFSLDKESLIGRTARRWKPFTIRKANDRYELQTKPGHTYYTTTAHCPDLWGDRSLHRAEHHQLKKTRTPTLPLYGNPVKQSCTISTSLKSVSKSVTSNWRNKFPTTM